MKVTTTPGQPKAASGSAAPPVQPEQYLALCLAAKDQHLDLREWLDHHLALGVSKIYLFDDHSDPPMLPAVTSYVEAGLVNYHYVQHFSHPSNRTQLYVYDYCIEHFRHQHTWIAFIDIDEFFVLRGTAAGSSLPAFLRQYEGYGGLAVHWRVFGSSGHIVRPGGSLLGSFHRCLPADQEHNQHVKTIANTRHVVHVGLDPHHCVYQPPYTAVNELGLPVLGARGVHPTTDHIALHHYALKSLQEYEAKMARGSAMKNHKTMEFFNDIDSLATENCHDVLGTPLK
eukprot:jgi/Astpho2/5717/e_gw1.00079.119.1_t